MRSSREERKRETLVHKNSEKVAFFRNGEGWRECEPKDFKAYRANARADARADARAKPSTGRKES